MKYNVVHTTSYSYSEPVPIGHNQVHLQPRNFFRQRCDQHQLTISPRSTPIQSWLDYFGNHVNFFSVEEVHESLTVTARSVVKVYEPAAVDPAATISWEIARDTVASVADDVALEAAQFTFDSAFVLRSDEALAYASPSFPPGRPLLAAALDLTARIFRDFNFDATATTVNTPTAEVFRLRRGVCQDFAHLQITCLRSLGLAARYVSGYLLTEPPPGRPKLIGADASHAWVSLYCPGLGWLDFDPTNNQIPSVRHVTLAWGRDYADVCPIKGVFVGGGQHMMKIAVDVTPLL